jgi:hypothetical protein
MRIGVEATGKGSMVCVMLENTWNKSLNEGTRINHVNVQMTIAHQESIVAGYQTMSSSLDLEFTRTKHSSFSPLTIFGTLLNCTNMI